MPKMVFNEWFGELPFKLNGAFKAYNVSPSDYDDLQDCYGDDFEAIYIAVTHPDHQLGGSGKCFSTYLWRKNA